MSSICKFVRDVLSGAGGTSLVVVLSFANLTQSLRAQNTGITGLVKNASGQPVAGALVEVRSKNPGLSFTVVSQDQGRYATPKLLPGMYVVQAFGGTDRSAATAAVEVTNGHRAKADVELTESLKVPPPAKRPTDEDYAKMMPVSDPTEIQEITISDCKECHTLRWTLAARKTREQWQQTVNRMYHDLLGRRMPLWFALKDDEFVGGKRFDRLIDYLSKNFGPPNPVDPSALEPWVARGSTPHPNRNLPVALLKGAAAKYVAVEFSLPPGSTPTGISIDSQGIAWVTEGATGMLGRFDPNSLAYTRASIPAGGSLKFQLNAVAVDPHDQIWFADDGPNSRILEFDPKSKQFASYPIPEYPWAVSDEGPARIATLRFQDGKVWGTRLTAQKILLLDPVSRSVKEYPVPRGSRPFGLAVAGNDAVWYAAQVGNVVVKLNPITGDLTPHDAPAERSDLRGLAIDANGTLWTAATEAGKLLKVNGQTGMMTEIALPTPDAGPYSVDVDTKGGFVWLSEMFTDRIARFDPRSNAFTEFSLPEADLDVRRIEVDRSNPNRVWWSGTLSGKIGYVEAQ